MKCIFYDAKTNELFIPNWKLAHAILTSLVYSPKELPHIKYIGEL